MNEDVLDFAKKLSGRQYLNEITSQEEKEAKQLNLVVIFGQSDDLIELRGAINDEIGCYEGGIIPFRNKDVFELKNPFEDIDEQISFLESFGVELNLKKVEAVWCDKDLNCSWSYKTDIPHQTFDIFEDDELYCKGIVFSLDDI